MEVIVQFSTVFLFACKVSSQVLVPGPCADHAVVQNFNVNSVNLQYLSSQEYLGTWYEIENTFASYEGDGICVAANYSDLGNGTIRVFNSRIIPENGELSSVTGSARLANPSRNEAKLLVNFPQMGASEGPYWVLDTDYQSYSIVWSCRPAQVEQQSLQTFWLLSRTSTATEDRRRYVHEYISALNFDVSNLEETTQTNCPNTYNLID